jgi:hypothetical protein
VNDDILKEFVVVDDEEFDWQNGVRISVGVVAVSELIENE